MDQQLNIRNTYRNRYIYYDNVDTIRMNFHSNTLHWISIHLTVPYTVQSKFMIFKSGFNRMFHLFCVLGSDNIFRIRIQNRHGFFCRTKFCLHLLGFDNPVVSFRKDSTLLRYYIHFKIKILNEIYSLALILYSEI